MTKTDAVINVAVANPDKNKMETANENINPILAANIFGALSIMTGSRFVKDIRWYEIKLKGLNFASVKALKKKSPNKNKGIIIFGCIRNTPNKITT